MESKYKIFTSNINLQPKVKVNLDRLQQIFDYYGDILYRKERYFVEFIFTDYILTKDSILPIYRTNRKTTSEIRYGLTRARQLIITIERFDNVFISNIDKTKIKFF